MSETALPIEGGLHVTGNGERYGVLKVLKVEEDIVHVRIYKNRFAEVPGQIDPSTLTLGTIHDADGFGIGHTPIKLEAFLAWHPRFLQHSLVEPDELEGYEEWKECGGGVWS